MSGYPFQQHSAYSATSPVPTANSWTADAITSSLGVDHSDVGITIEPAPPEGHDPADEASQAPPMDYVYNNGYLLPPSPFAHRRRRSFDLPRPASDGLLRTHSDTTGSRPHFEQLYQLEGSALDDDPCLGPSPYGSAPSSPAHSGYFSPSLSLPSHFQATCSNILPPALTRRPSTSSFSNSDTSGPSEWDGGLTVPAHVEDVGDAYREQLPSSPMVPTPWDAGLLNVPGPMYREWHGSSFSGSETSSNAPHSPNPQWDHPSPSVGSDHGVEVNLSSQRWTTDSSGRPEHPDNNDQFDEMIRQFQLSDAFSPREASTWRHSSQGRHDISVPDLSPQDILPHDEHQPGFRRVVATPATRRAAKFRRKKAASFVCMVCGADFTANHNLKNHLNSHRSIKGFRCDQCAQCFGTAHVLRRHLKKCKKRLQET